MLAEQSFWDSLHHDAMRAFEELVPPLERRQPLTLAFAPIAYLGPFLPFCFLAYLARRADTHLIRLLVLPAVITITVYFTYQYKIEDHRYRLLEFARFILGYHIIGMSLNFAFTREGRYKMGEKRLKRVGDPEPLCAADPGPLPPCLRDGLELAVACRGIGWDFGHDVYVTPRTTSTERSQFLADTAIYFLKHVLALDLCDSLVKLVPGVGTPDGGSIFLPGLAPHLRYSLSIVISTLEAGMIGFTLEACNEFISLLAVGLFNSAPESWKPLYGYPWRATSLHEFWGKSWHQTLRHVFLSFGGYPGLWLGGKAGLVLGVFFASGMFHALILQVSDYRVVLFFELQGVGLLLESVYRHYTGKRVGGSAGWCWTAVWVFILGQLFADGYSIGGLPGAIIVPEELSVVRRVVFKLPAVRYLAQWVVSR